MHEDTVRAPEPTGPDGRPDDTGRPPARRHGLWWLLAAAALPWVAVAAVLAAGVGR